MAGGLLVSRILRSTGCESLPVTTKTKPIKETENQHSSNAKISGKSLIGTSKKSETPAHGNIAIKATVGKLPNGNYE